MTDVVHEFIDQPSYIASFMVQSKPGSVMHFIETQDIAFAVNLIVPYFVYIMSLENYMYIVCCLHF